jgi:nicotinamide-nucleotide amidase
MATDHNDTATIVTELVARLANQLETRGWRLATAESCTGGLVAGTCTERAGSSVWFERGVVSYSNAAKTSLLGVPADLIVAEGAVSEAVARAMALGAQADLHGTSAVDVAVSITGVAGPGGGSAAKPVGTVCFGWALPGRCWTERCWFDGDRAAVRRQSVALVLGRLVDALESLGPGRPADQDTGVR